MIQNNVYCVYIHKLDNKVFWVGHGNIHRPYIFINRSRYWKDYVQNRKKDVQIEIVKYFEDKKSAYEYEIQYSIEMRENGEPVQGLIGHQLTDELKQKVCGYHHLTEEGKKNLSIKVSKAMLGRKFTEEHKNKLSESHKGKPSNRKRNTMYRRGKAKNKSCY